MSLGRPHILSGAPNVGKEMNPIRRVSVSIKDFADTLGAF